MEWELHEREAEHTQMGLLRFLGGGREDMRNSAVMVSSEPGCEEKNVMWFLPPLTQSVLVYCV